MKLKSIANYLLMSMLSLVMISGCTKVESKPKDTSLSPDDKSKTVTETKEIKFLAVSAPGIEYRINTFKKAKQKFEETHKNTVVTIQEVSPPDYAKKLKDLTTTGKSPDLIYIKGGVELKDYNTEGYLADLLPLLQANKVTKDQFYPAILDMATINNKLLIIPTSLTTTSVLYNKKWFDNAGLKYPEGEWTWEQFVDIAKKLQAANQGNNKYGVVIPFNADFLEPIILSNGGSLVSEDGWTTKGYLDSKKTLDAIQYVIDLVKLHKVMPPLIGDEGLFDKSFASGNAGMRVAAATSADMANKDVGIASLPKFAGGVRANAASIAGIGISAASQNKQLAFDFLQTIAIDDNEFTRELNKTDLLASRKLTDNDPDPRKKIIANEFNYAQKAAYEKNTRFIDAAWAVMNPKLGELFKEQGTDVTNYFRQMAVNLDNELLKYKK